MKNHSVPTLGFKLSLRLRDVFVDFLACLIPGFIFITVTSVLVISLIIIVFFILKSPAVSNVALQNVMNFVEKKLFSSGILFWFHAGVIVFSYVAGHLLYRQDPKEPDYRSFIKIRETVMGFTAWVIEKGGGIVPDDIQFPYSNLKRYLSARSFDHLNGCIKWDPQDFIQLDDPNHVKELEKRGNNRSKSFINQLKMRISFIYPDNNFSLIKNEAHIRLASSMWYFAKFTISLSYFIITILCIVIWKYYESTPKISNAYFFLLPIAALCLGLAYRHKSENIIRYIRNIRKKGAEHNGTDDPIQGIKERIKGIKKKICDIRDMVNIRITQEYKDSCDNLVSCDDTAAGTNEGEFDDSTDTKKPNMSSGKKTAVRERIISKKVRDIRFGYNIYDNAPFFASLSVLGCFLCFYLIHPNDFFDENSIMLEILVWYSISVFFILTGIKFLKGKIEDSFHYQRVREIIYACELAALTNLIDFNEARSSLSNLKAPGGYVDQTIKVVTH